MKLEKIFKKTSYIDQRYIDWLKKENITSVGILFNMEDSVIKNIMRNLNGILFTGGASPFFNKKNGKPTHYLKKVKMILEEAKRINREERYFFIWATCLG